MPIRQSLRACATALLVAASLAPVTPALAALPLPALRPLQATAVVGEDIHAIGAEHWLQPLANGLVVSGAGGTKLLAKGRFESIDARDDIHIDGRALTLISMIDIDSGQLRLLTYDPLTQELVASTTLDYADAIPETQCLFRHPDSGNLSLYTVDARGMLEQRYVYHAQKQTLVDLLVRRDIAAPEAQACAVDDRDGSLYIAEEPLGVWRYAAIEESDPLRDPVLLRTPHGRLAGAVQDIAVDAQGTLWVLVQEPGRLYRMTARKPDIDEPGGESIVHEWLLPAQLQAGAVTAWQTDGATVLGLHDEASMQHLLSTISDPSLPAPTPAAPDSPASSSRDSVPALHAVAETDPVRRYGDAADDPAIFIDRDNAAASLILGTDKREGLAVYRLDGHRQQMLAVGRVNNVDLLQDIPLGERRRNIAAASNRSTNSISLFDIHEGVVTHLADLPTGLDDVYGLCMHAADDRAYVYINATDGRYEQYRLDWNESGPSAVLLRQWRLPSQPEGCVADPHTGRLYMGEEAAGIWSMNAVPDAEAPALIIALSDALVADVEGMDIYRNAQSAYLVVSSQGSDSFAVFNLESNYALNASFRIDANLAARIDGVSETDGLAISAAPLPGYPAGILVVQDGRNRMPDAPQNFKIVDWRELEALLDLEKQLRTTQAEVN